MAHADPVYVFLHVPKTGGTTIIRHLRRTLAWDEEFVHLGGWGNNFRERRGLTPFLDRSAAERHKARILAGHQTRLGIHEAVDRPPRYFTVMRDPAARILSAYNFRMQMEDLDLSFDDWYATYPRNNAFKWLRTGLNLDGSDAFEDTKWAMRRMWWVGLTETLDDDLPYLFRAFGAPAEWTNQRTSVPDEDEVAETERVADEDEDNKAWVYGKKVYKRLEMTDALRDRLYEDNRRDFKLHKIAKRLHARKLPRLHKAGAVAVG